MTTQKEPFVTENQAAEHLTVAVRTLQRWRCEGAGPRWYRLGKRRCAYKLSDLESWAERNACRSTAEAKQRAASSAE